MNQILITEKVYVTPEIKRKKLIYKIELFLSIFLICLLFSYYIYAEYDRNKSEQVSKEILAQIKYQLDDTVKKTEDDVIVVILNEEQEKEHADKIIESPDINTQTYVSADGVEYTTDAILKIPSIDLEYPVLSETSEELLEISLNKYWGPKPNEIGNYCIIGHNYASGVLFGKLYKLQNGDIAQLTDLSGRTITYQVYDIEIVKPTDTSCTSQKRQRENRIKELTLITCSNNAKDRRIVKLREVQ